MINFNKMIGCAEGMQNTGKGHFYNGGKSGIFGNALLLKKIDPNQFISFIYK